MTITTETRRAGPYTGNGANTAFPFSFKVFAKTDIAVYKKAASGVEGVLLLDSDYSVSLSTDQDNTPGGSVTYPLSGAPLQSTEQLVIIGALRQVQLMDLLNGGGFYPQVIENEADYLTILIQQLAETLARAIVVPVTSSNDVSSALPIPTPLYLIGWDAVGKNLVNYPPGGATGVTIVQGSVPDYLQQNIGIH